MILLAGGDLGGWDSRSSLALGPLGDPGKSPLVCVVHWRHLDYSAIRHFLAVSPDASQLFFFFWFKFLFPSHSWALCREISQNRGSGGTLKLEANPDVRASPSLSYKPHVSADRSFAHAKFYSHLICFYTSTGRNGFLLKKIKRKKEKRNNEIMTVLVKQPLVRDLNCGCSLLTVNTAVVLSVHFLA